MIRLSLIFTSEVSMRRSPFPPVLLAAASTAFIIVGCGSKSDDNALAPASTGPGTTAAAVAAVDVVATSTQLGDIVRAVGGSAVNVHQILKPNTDPHGYEPRPADVKETMGAKLVVTSGDGLDEWMADVVKAAGAKPATLDAGLGRPITLPGASEQHEAEEGLEHSEEPEHEHEASRFDPHWWHDPVNVEYAVGKIRDALLRVNPGAGAAITRSADVYLGMLRKLDAGIKQCVDAVPPDERRLVTDHDAFGYFTRRYGIHTVGAVIPSQSTQAQPSAGELASLVALIKREGVRAIFPESSVNPKLAQAIAGRTGATADLTLYGDTLGPAGSPGSTYIGMEQANADAMVRGFTGGRMRCEIAGL